MKELEREMISVVTDFMHQQKATTKKLNTIIYILIISLTIIVSIFTISTTYFLTHTIISTTSETEIIKEHTEGADIINNNNSIEGDGNSITTK